LLKKVLVVDDSPQIHLTYKMVLMRYKCAVLGSLNGQEGLYTLTRNDDVNLMIIDCNMPLMNGLEFIRAVRRLGIYDHIPIIAVRTMDEEEDTIKAVAFAQGCLRKPFTSSELHALIEKLFPAVVSR
jgi:two-component system, chemotaxis family, chemotaxis protein CheY